MGRKAGAPSLAGLSTPAGRGNADSTRRRGVSRDL